MVYWKYKEGNGPSDRKEIMKNIEESQMIALALIAEMGEEGIELENLWFTGKKYFDAVNWWYQYEITTEDGMTCTQWANGLHKDGHLVCVESLGI